MRSISLHWASYHSTINYCYRGHRPCVNLVFHSWIKHITINIFFIARDLANKGQRSEGLLQVSPAGAWISIRRYFSLPLQMLFGFLCCFVFPFLSFYFLYRYFVYVEWVLWVNVSLCHYNLILLWSSTPLFISSRWNFNAFFSIVYGLCSSGSSGRIKGSFEVRTLYGAFLL